MDSMKRFGLMLLALVFATAGVHAQDDELESFDWDDVEEDFDNTDPYYAVAGGFTTTLHFGNFDDITGMMNQVLPDEGDITSPMVMTGWEVVLALGFVENLRVGYSSMSGTDIHEGSVQITPNGSEPVTVDRRFQYSMDFQGPVVDYAIQLSNDFAVLPGLGVYFGTMQINSSQSSGDRSFDSEFDFGADNLNNYRLLEASHISLGLSLDIEYIVTNFAMIRVNGGYMLSLTTGDWEVDRIVSPVSNAPGFDTSGLTLQGGIFVGLFN